MARLTKYRSDNMFGFPFDVTKQKTNDNMKKKTRLPYLQSLTIFTLFIKFHSYN